MQKLIKLTKLMLLPFLAACTLLAGPAPRPGDTADQVRAAWGAPTAMHPGPVWEYASGPFGQTTWMLRLGPDGRVASVRQVLTGETFTTIRVDKASKADVLQTIGRPAERSRVMMHNYEVWSYRYKEAGVWNSMMHVHFDQDGIVRMMQNGPDPMFEEKARFFD
jgi:hypothetical protein